jgi:excisionase family DNA binding protein
MSSNIEIQRICQYCKSEFTARTTVTKYCSMKCTKAVSRDKTRNAKIEISNAQVRAVKVAPILDLKAKEFLTVKETAFLFGCSKQNVYKAINTGKLTAVNFGIKITRVRRSDLDTFQTTREIAHKPTRQKEYDISECCTIGEAQIKFGISQSGLRNLLIKHNVPKIQKHKFVYVPIAVIEKILS